MTELNKDISTEALYALWQQRSSAILQTPSNASGVELPQLLFTGFAEAAANVEVVWKAYQQGDASEQTIRTCLYHGLNLTSP
jgi:hypothetical protein